MIDLHSHLLPAVDDGSRSVAQTVGVLAALAGLGVTDICLTPHLTVSQAQRGRPPKWDVQWEALRAAAPATPRLHRGVELMMDRPLTRELAAGLTLAGSRYLLIEFPRIVPRHVVETAITQVVECGLVPIVAHPERYSSCSPPAANAWRKAGGRLQLDATTLLVPSERGDRARALLAAGLADLVAADNHGDERSPAGVAAALREEGAAEAAELLTVGNPRAVLEDGEMTAVGPVTLPVSLGWRIRRIWRGTA